MNKTVTRVDRVQSPGEEIANSVSAGVGLIGAIAGIPLLLASTSQRGSIGLLQVRWSSLRTTLLLYLASTLGRRPTSWSLHYKPSVLKEDEEIDILEKQVDQDGVNLLIRFHPVASDMREVVSAMKVSSNLERIADQSVSIARRAKHLNNKPAVRELALLEPPYRLALTIFRDSMRAFADGDYELAGTLKLKDRELDALTNDVNEKLVERATQDSELVPNYVDLIFVARALERIGDHATIANRSPKSLNT
jgi:phosphate transport system regulatory protein PhoU